MTAPYPWLAQAWKILHSESKAQQMAHAYLLRGRSGLGKSELASTFANFLVCEAQSAGEACGACRGCLLRLSGNHPDLALVKPSEEGKNIQIEQIRDLIDFFSLRPHFGTRKIALILTAELLNNAAANALLKILEEPPPGGILFLVSHAPAPVPATILSRCRRLELRQPEDSTVIRWLEEQNLDHDSGHTPIDQRSFAGGPLEMRAVLRGESEPCFDVLAETLWSITEQAITPVQAVERLRMFPADEVLLALESLLASVLQLLFGAGIKPLQANKVTSARLQRMANHLNSRTVFGFLDRLRKSREVLRKSAGIRGNEALETIFLHWGSLKKEDL